MIHRDRTVDEKDWIFISFPFFKYVDFSSALILVSFNSIIIKAFQPLKHSCEYSFIA